MPLAGLNFTKMHGLGNDFVVVDNTRQTLDPSPENIHALADRHRGVGCDQVLLVENPRIPQADFRYRIFNADGSEVEQCGNGARCFARYVIDHGLAAGPSIQVETLAGLLKLHLQDNGQVTVDMGTPHLHPDDIPFLAETPATAYILGGLDQHYEIGVLSMGNPHAVLQVDNVDTAPVATLGPAIETHPRFPNRTNVGFMQVLSSEHIRLRVYERGTGETQACGTGACAAVVSGYLRGWLAVCVTVDLPGGQLVVEWEGGDTPVKMTGPVTTVFEGRIVDDYT